MSLIKDLYTPLDNTFMGWTLSILVWVLSLVIAGLILWGIYSAVNFLGVQNQRGEGRVTFLYHKNSYVTTQPILVGKVIIPQTQYHPETWNVSIDFNGKNYSTSVSKDFYHTLRIGQKIRFTYQQGRLNKSSVLINDFL